MKLIEEYIHEGIGYNPFFIREGWQVAKLNPLPRHGLGEIDRIEVHEETDEVFVLICGTGILIGAQMNNDQINFEITVMKPGIVYNLPKGLWHNIAMDKGAEIVIIEKDNTHLNDCCYKDLDIKQQNQLRQLIQQKLNNK